ncbi:hypothetical protein H8J79_03300 [Clostridium perfringens]|uniref:hypothetical protein n=1 Tax=Clostridium perfringens TaxID=1502 RepID=UPI0018E4693F|nr:hypothetical protein [Clostridium perfringens]MBI6019859.1 hypothetical protein [Clostridium perfringens]
MRLWRFENNTEAVKENMRNEKVLSQLATNLKVFIDNKIALAKIIERSYGLESGQITLREIEILQEQLKEKGIDRFIKQFKQFGNFGYTPYILG